MSEEYGYCKKHEDKIIDKLELENRPKILYGTRALKFFVKYGEGTSCGYNGYFLYKNLSDKYALTGVICIFKPSVATLAHELQHAKQFSLDNKCFNKTYLGKFKYWFWYEKNPYEIEAFNFAQDYIKSEKLCCECCSYTVHRKKIKYQNITKRTLVYIVVLIYLVLIINIFVTNKILL